LFVKVVKEFESSVGETLLREWFREGMAGLAYDLGSHGGGGDDLQAGGVFGNDFGSDAVAEVIGFPEEVGGVMLF
jgi:hypothetical protein